MYRLTGQFAGFAKIEDLREEIERVLPGGSDKKARGTKA